MRTLLVLALISLAPLILPRHAAAADVHSEVIGWKVDEVEFSGHLVYPTAGGPHPGIVMVPNWMGVNASALDKAKAIAADGYVVLLADVYGADLRPANAQEAGAAAGKAYADRAQLRRRVAAAADLLQAQPASVPLKKDSIAAIGFCFGGASVLELARSGYALDAVVSFHGALDTSMPAQAGAVKASVLVLNGADDTYVAAEHIDALQKEMRDAGADWQFVNFAGAVHCFAEADAASPPGCVYHERSAKRAYRMMHAHLREAFGG
jgi:dienelactone hydrolase